MGVVGEAVEGEAVEGEAVEGEVVEGAPEVVVGVGVVTTILDQLTGQPH